MGETTRLNFMLDEVRWAMAKGFLEEEGIPFTALNEQFSSLYPGPAIGAFQREILIPASEEKRVREGLAELFSEESPPPSTED